MSNGLENKSVEELILCEASQIDRRLRYFYFVFSENVLYWLHPASSKRGVSRSSRTWSAGSDGRTGSQHDPIMRTNDIGTHGEVVWSWHPGADAKLAVMLAHHADDGGKNAGPQGEHV